MTWRCIREQIEALTQEQQESDASIYVKDCDETWRME